MFCILQVLFTSITASKHFDAPNSDTKDKMNLRFLSRYIFDTLFYCHCIVSLLSESIRQYIQETDNIRDYCFFISRASSAFILLLAFWPIYHSTGDCDIQGSRDLGVTLCLWNTGRYLQVWVCLWILAIYSILKFKLPLDIWWLWIIVDIRIINVCLFNTQKNIYYDITVADDKSAVNLKCKLWCLGVFHNNLRLVDIDMSILLFFN